MRQLLVILLTCFTLTLSFGQVAKDTVLDNRSKQLSFKVACVVPVYYNFHFSTPDIQGKYQKYNFQPTFNLSSLLGFQYKNKRNVLFDLQFQHYNFEYRGPIWEAQDWLGINTIRKYYEVINYSEYRISFGAGKQIKINNKNTLSIVLGSAFYLGDQGNSYDKSYYSDGTFSQMIVSKSYGARLGAYGDVCYSYFILKNLALISAINYSFNFKDGGGTGYESYYDTRSLLSINIGVKYNLLNKLVNSIR